MADEPRALRNLREDITAARTQLTQWRRLDLLLDRYPRAAHVSRHAATADSPN
jgi:hypothetical protein